MGHKGVLSSQAELSLQGLRALRPLWCVRHKKALVGAMDAEDQTQGHLGQAPRASAAPTNVETPPVGPYSTVGLPRVS